MTTIEITISQYLAPAPAKELTSKLQGLIEAAAREKLAAVRSAFDSVFGGSPVKAVRAEAPKAAKTAKAPRTAAKSKAPKAAKGGSVSNSTRQKMSEKKKLYWAQRRIERGEGSSEDHARVKAAGIAVKPKAARARKVTKAAVEAPAASNGVSAPVAGVSEAAPI